MNAFPAWAAVGAEVLIVSRYYSQTSLSRGTVTRHTKTRICVTVNGRERQFVTAKYRDGIWEEYGVQSRWQSADHLADPAADEGKELIAEHTSAVLLHSARAACNKFDSTRTPSAALSAVDALTAYLEDQK